MKKFALLILSCFTINFLSAQSLYFPPLLGNTWDTVSPSTYNWCQPNLDSLHHFLDTNQTKAFIILKNGKIAVEWYYDTFTQDSLWYWASAGKTITSFLVGVAQEEGYLSIHDTTSKYLGVGWTDCSTKQEENISILNQLTMTTGLDDGIINPDCTDDSCLLFLADADTRWAYHNAPYTLLTSVLENATSTPLNTYTQQKLKNKTGMSGLWLDVGDNEVFFSNARSMARFGLMIQNKGIWDEDTLLHDTTYFQNMVNTSQPHNLSYGYLWWLNGKPSYMLPQSQFVFSNTLVSTAPVDMIAALGKNDQKVYVIPSQNMVVIRMGETSGIPLLALSNFDELLWHRITKLDCTPVSAIAQEQLPIQLFPNPAKSHVIIKNAPIKAKYFKILDISGNTLQQQSFNGMVQTENLNAGIYFIQLLDENNTLLKQGKLIIQN